VGVFWTRTGWCPRKSTMKYPRRETGASWQRGRASPSRETKKKSSPVNGGDPMNIPSSPCQHRALSSWFSPTRRWAARGDRTSLPAQTMRPRDCRPRDNHRRAIPTRWSAHGKFARLGQDPLAKQVEGFQLVKPTSQYGPWSEFRGQVNDEAGRERRGEAQTGCHF